MSRTDHENCRHRRQDPRDARMRRIASVLVVIIGLALMVSAAISGSLIRDIWPLVFGS